MRCSLLGGARLCSRAPPGPPLTRGRCAHALAAAACSACHGAQRASRIISAAPAPVFSYIFRCTAHCLPRFAPLHPPRGAGEGPNTLGPPPAAPRCPFLRGSSCPAPPRGAPRHGYLPPPSALQQPLHGAGLLCAAPPFKRHAALYLPACLPPSCGTGKRPYCALHLLYADCLCCQQPPAPPLHCRAALGVRLHLHCLHCPVAAAPLHAATRPSLETRQQAPQGPLC